MRRPVASCALIALALVGGCAPRRPVYTSPPPVYVPGPGIGIRTPGYSGGPTGSFTPRDSSGRTRGGFSTPNGTGSYTLTPQGRGRGFSRPSGGGSTGGGFSRPDGGTGAHARAAAASGAPPAEGEASRARPAAAPPARGVAGAASAAARLRVAREMAAVQAFRPPVYRRRLRFRTAAPSSRGGAVRHPGSVR